MDPVSRCGGRVFRSCGWPAVGLIDLLPGLGSGSLLFAAIFSRFKYAVSLSLYGRMSHAGDGDCLFRDITVVRGSGRPAFILKLQQVLRVHTVAQPDLRRLHTGIEHRVLPLPIPQPHRSHSSSGVVDHSIGEVAVSLARPLRLHLRQRSIRRGKSCLRVHLRTQLVEGIKK